MSTNNHRKSPFKFPLREILIGIPLILLAIIWSYSTIESNSFVLRVNQFHLIPAFETKWLYGYLHLFISVPVLLLSFDRRVAFYKNWKNLFPAIAIIALFFIVWDIFFTYVGVWAFNPMYISGIQFFHLPIEEILFFLTVPFASVFIYDCLNHYAKKDWLAPVESKLTPILICCFFLIGIFNYTRLYSSSTFILAGTVLLYHYLYARPSFRSRFYLAYLVSWFPFLLVNGVLTGACTQEPIVIYNPEEYLGLRIISIPVDDAVYSFLLLFLVIGLYERFKKKSAISS